MNLARAIDALERARERLARDPRWRAELALIDLAIADMQPSDSALRMRRMRAKGKASPVTPPSVTGDATSDVTSDAQVTSPVTPRPPSALPRSDSQRSGISKSSLTPKITDRTPQNARAQSVTSDASQVTLADHLRAELPLADGLVLADAVAAHLKSAGLRRFDAAQWRADLAWIGEQPADDVERAVRHALADDWVLANLGRANPGHLRKHWQKYLDGPMRAVSDAPAPSDDDARADRLRRKARLESEIADLDARAHFDGDEAAGERADKLREQLAALDAPLKPIARAS